MIRGHEECLRRYSKSSRVMGENETEQPVRMELETSLAYALTVLMGGCVITAPLTTVTTAL